MRQQRGGTFLGIVIGVVVGLGAALAVAIYVTKVPVPFLNKSPPRKADQDAAEALKNKDWDPNAPLYGKNPARTTAPTASGVVQPPAPAVAPP
ncbi:MAG: sporulation protein, partial [Burkholderiaceae bacterium]